MMTQTTRRNPLAAVADVTLASDAAMPSIVDAKDLLYDYSQIAEADRETVIWAAVDIKKSVRRSATVIGERLTEVKERLPHGQWQDWLKTEFDWSERTAENVMNAARLVAKNEKFSVLSNSVQYLLGAPSTPEPAREAVLEVAATGEKVTHQKAKAIVEAHKPPKPTPIATMPPQLPQTPVFPTVTAATVPNQGQTGAKSVPNRKPWHRTDAKKLRQWLDKLEEAAGALDEMMGECDRHSDEADDLAAQRVSLIATIDRWGA